MSFGIGLAAPSIGGVIGGLKLFVQIHILLVLGVQPVILLVWVQMVVINSVA